jgi:HD-GYP domain-containing protein (c-di-GMP phosphodiesterase class II)
MRKDGSRVEVAILGYPIKFNNDYIGMIAIYRDLTGSNGSKKELQDTLAKLRKTMNGIVHAMVSTVEIRDPYTAGHQERVANLASAIAQELDIPKDEIEGIQMAGTLHDLGKISIPAEILSRPGQLTDIEFSLIKRHPEIAYKILQNIDTPWPIAEIVYQHHERLDGSGYPRGLKGEEIQLAARILTVADVVEAIASHRPYRPALGVKKAVCEITRNSGILYDEKVVDACVKIIKEQKICL